MGPIALLTDFGNRDWYVASMKGVIHTILPEARIVDISHEIRPGDRREAAFLLSQCYGESPRGTVFLVVVDPGVGGSRLGIAVHAGDQFFVGPDNGVLSFHDLVDNEIAREARVIENRDFMGAVLSSTFHGRDVFAPVGARLLRAGVFKKVGARLSSIVKINWPRAKYEEGGSRGELIYVDHFGNGISNIRAALLGEPASLQSATVSVSGQSIPLAGTFSDVELGRPVAYVGSGGFVEIAVNRGNAARAFGLGVGCEVELVLLSGPGE